LAGGPEVAFRELKAALLAELARRWMNAATEKGHE